MTTEIVQTGLCNLIVCTDDDDETMKLAANREYPTGISSRWDIVIKNDGMPDVLICDQDPSRRHALLEC